MKTYRWIAAIALIAALVGAGSAQAFSLHHPRMTVARGKAAIFRHASIIGQRAGADPGTTGVGQCSRSRQTVWCTVGWDFNTNSSDPTECSSDQASARWVGILILVHIPGWSIYCQPMNIAP